MTYSNQVACERFIDDIAVEAVETSLLAKLGDIFSPLKVTCLAADVVTSVAGESDESRAKRKQLTNQLDVLAHGLETCKKFVVGTLHGANAWLSAGTRDLTIIQGKPGTCSPDLSLLSLNTGSSENVSVEGPPDVGVIEDDKVCPIEPVSEPRPGPELDEAAVEVVYAVEEVPEPPDDGWGFSTTVNSGEKKKKKSKMNLNW